MFMGRTKTASFSTEDEVGKGPRPRSHALRGGLVRVCVIGTQQARDRTSHKPGHPGCSAQQKPTAAGSLNIWTNTNRGFYFLLSGEGRNSPSLPLSPELRRVRQMPSSYKKRVLWSDRILSGQKKRKRWTYTSSEKSDKNVLKTQLPVLAISLCSSHSSGDMWLWVRKGRPLEPFLYFDSSRLSSLGSWAI